MSMFVEIPDDMAKQLQEQAVAIGSLPEQVALGAIRSSLAEKDRLATILAPVREAFKQSGMTEDELAELLEDEKHAMRRGE